jgi:hypothetical protein
MRPRFVRPLSEEERAEVTQAYRASTSADLVRRCHAVLLSADVHPIPAIARSASGGSPTGPRKRRNGRAPRSWPRSTRARR